MEIILTRYDEIVKNSYELSETIEDFDTNFFIMAYCDKRNRPRIDTGMFYLLLYSYPKDPHSQLKVKLHLNSLPYKDFLGTPYWKIIAFRVKELAKFKCNLCASKIKLTTHHRQYINKGKEILFLEDLICLCDACHTKFHDL